MHDRSPEIGLLVFNKMWQFLFSIKIIKLNAFSVEYLTLLKETFMSYFETNLQIYSFSKTFMKLVNLQLQKSLKRNRGYASTV
jgi:hypothetical protein